jgi:hypothetical protein
MPGSFLLGRRVGFFDLECFFSSASRNRELHPNVAAFVKESARVLPMRKRMVPIRVVAEFFQQDPPAPSDVHEEVNEDFVGDVANQLLERRRVL